MSRCFVSLVMAVTGGVSWVNMVVPLRSISDVYEWVFIFYVLFLQLGVLNIFTSMFVAQASSFTQNDPEIIEREEMEARDRLIKDLHEVFDVLDADGSGIIDMEEFMAWRTNNRSKAFFQEFLES